MVSETTVDGDGPFKRLTSDYFFTDSSGALGGDGRGPILVSLDAPTQVAAPDVAYPDGRLLVDQLGTGNLAPLVVATGGVRQINPGLATGHVQVIKDTHGRDLAAVAGRSRRADPLRDVDPVASRPGVLHATAMTHPRAFHPLDPRSVRMRLVLAAGLGMAAWLVAPWPTSVVTRALLAWDVAGLVLFGLALLIITRSDARETRRRAAAYDPGRRLVWLIVLAASAFSLFAAAAVLRQGHEGTPVTRALHVALCIATVVVSWLVTHSGFTLRYAHLYYRDAEREGGIELPGNERPDDFDFAYFAFTIAMCFQVSDATISSKQIRRTALGQALLSFVYNTVIMALVLNLLVGQLG